MARRPRGSGGGHGRGWSGGGHGWSGGSPSHSGYGGGHGHGGYRPWRVRGYGHGYWYPHWRVWASGPVYWSAGYGPYTSVYPYPYADPPVDSQ